ncbi:hypothetical protein [Bremerella sp. P1]|uniref:hypothetical protein n=1 Tax=Bremerella sp. P1 TaxID=3026424 RepID=UPI00236742BA|nr:hypothetical protein [Bremerella sp. P1]WDI39767.1 hypothetical protein PSR63_14860 [Bremerella sp. P1]
MSNTVENELCARLSDLLKTMDVDEVVPESDDSRPILSALESFVSHVIREIHEDFQWESLDGILPVEFRKRGDREIELLGGAYLISDQTVVPIYLRLQIDSADREVCWMECYLGQRLHEKMARTSHANLHKVLNQISSDEEKTSSIDWYYKVGFGEKV